jgi:hypothetical protein
MKSVKIYELYDDLWYKPWWREPQARWAMVIFVLVVLLVLAWFWYKKRRKLMVLSAWDQALFELNNLRAEDFHGYERHKEFYSQLTHILKVYLASRYKLDLLDKTDYEVLKDLRPLISSSVMLQKLESIMNGAVWAKFSSGDVAQKKMAEHVEDSIVLVKNTEPPQVRRSK